MRASRGERGQVLAVVALALVALLGISAFAIDVGYAYYAKRQLQSATDAAALAGAQDLPNGTTAVATATSYAAANTPPNLNLAFDYQVKCTSTSVSTVGCDPSSNPNELIVSGTATTNTWFARMLGIDHFTVSAHANACSPCSSAPVDIMLAIDRTGSMCTPTDSHGNCTDLDNAKDGVRTMLGILNPPVAEIGMLAFPPVQTTSSNVCGAPYNSLGSNGYDGYDSATRGYITDPLGTDYKTSATTLNTASGLYVHTTDGRSSACIQAGGNTSYSEALRQAHAELLRDGRPNVPKYIVLLTDGEANIGSVYGPGDPTYPPGNPDDQQPCHTAINLADAYKTEGMTIYTIGYALGNLDCTAGQWPWIKAVAAVKKKGKIVTPAVPAHWCDPSMGDTNCYHTAGGAGNPESPTITSNQTLSQIASPGDFYNQPNPGQLDTIFAAIASDIGAGSSRLVDDTF